MSEFFTKNNINIPSIGLGTWDLRGSQCENAIQVALDIGYRHIDTAQMYENEKDIGNALNNSKIGTHIVLVPIAFVSEHSETLVELDIEYKKLAMDNGCKQYTRIPALGTNEDFIKSMSELIIKKDEYKFNDYLYPPKIKCPSHLKKCPCLNYE